MLQRAARLPSIPSSLPACALPPDTVRNMPADLCNRCLRFDLRLCRGDGYRAEVEIVARGAEAGCRFCGLLMRHLDGPLETATLRNVANHKLWVHLFARGPSQRDQKGGLGSDGLGINRLVAAVAPSIWPRHSGWPIAPRTRELCVAAEPGNYTSVMVLFQAELILICVKTVLPPPVAMSWGAASALIWLPRTTTPRSEVGSTNAAATVPVTKASRATLKTSSM